MINNNDIKQPMIVVKGLYKSFKLPHEQHSGIKQFIINFTKRKRGYETQRVLNDINFEIKKGEFFGIVGRNGSGKSTLLKLLAGIYTPDKGLIQVNGSLTPFIELGVGFNPELTGRENIYLNGALLGFSRGEMTEMYDEIVDFAELEKFMDQKIKNYSSGMQVRLAFSIAIRAKSDILVLDEVLAVGDADFQKKCLNVFRSLKKEGRTIILVTHDMANVEKFCDRALVISKGKMVAVTTPSKASTIYSRLNIDDSKPVGEPELKKEINRWGSGGISIKNISIASSNKAISPILNFEDDLCISIEVKKEDKYKDTAYDVGLAFINQDNVTVAGPNSLDYELNVNNNTVVYDLKKSPLQPGDYNLTVVILDKETGEPYDFYNKAASFHVISDKPAQGVFKMDGIWSTK